MRRPPAKHRCGVERRGVLRVAHAGDDLVGGASESVAVLVDQEEPPIVGACDDVHPVGIFQHVIGGDACAAGEFDGFAPHGEPRLMRQIFAVQDFPGSVIGLFHGNSLFGKDTIFLRFPCGSVCDLPKGGTAERCRQFADIPRGGLHCAEARAEPAAVGESQKIP